MAKKIGILAKIYTLDGIKKGFLSLVSRKRCKKNTNLHIKVKTFPQILEDFQVIFRDK